MLKVRILALMSRLNKHEPGASPTDVLRDTDAKTATPRCRIMPGLSGCLDECCVGNWGDCIRPRFNNNMRHHILYKAERRGYLSSGVCSTGLPPKSKVTCNFSFS